MMTEKQRKFRAQYLANVSPLYNGILHVVVTYGVGIAMIAWCLSRTQDGRWEWLLLIPVGDAGNFVDYTAAGSPVWASNTWHDWSLTSANTDDQHLDTGQWMNSTASAARTGLISGHTRIWTTNEFSGFHGSVFPALFDDQNKMIWPTDIDAAKHQYGVDGTWIPGLPSDRTCYWTNQVPATVLAASHGLGLFQYKDPKNMLMRDLDLIGRAWKDVGPLVQAFVGS